MGRQADRSERATFSTTSKFGSVRNVSQMLRRIPHRTARGLDRSETTSPSSHAAGEAQPNWTQWRAFADQLTLRPFLTAAAIAPAPAPSGSEFVDNLLAGTAEKLADDTGIRRPSWTLRFPPLRTPWRALGTPRMRADHAARTPPQFVARNITLPATSIWRDREMALA